ncbi:MAG TPA: hypothetical protein VEB68_05615 [Croceibacterium sp.]|nr:hypothetical protein [Croceibacterium sp.]
MTAHRATILAAAAAALVTAGAPAAAQVDRNIVLNIMIECAKIDDPTARLACYDNNISAAGGTARATVPGQVPGPVGGGAPVASNTPQGFGYEDVRAPQRFQAPSGQLDQISTRITSIRLRQPGIYAFTLEGGAQWQFTEGVSASYRLPREGETVEIERGSLGSFLMVFDDQRAVPVRRVR